MDSHPGNDKSDSQSASTTQNFELAPMKSENDEDSQSSPVYVNARSHPAGAASSESRGVGARFIAGFAAVGLLAAGAVGVWTLQTTDNSTQDRQESVAEQSQVSELTGESSSNEPQSANPRDATESPRMPSAAGSSSASHSSERGGSLSSLQDDPYLPPNSWSGHFFSTQSQPSSIAPSVEQSPSSVSEPSTPTPSAPSQPNSWTDDLGLPDDPGGIFDEITPGTSKATTEPQPTETLTELPTSAAETTEPSEPSTPGATSTSESNTAGAQSTGTSTSTHNNSSAPTTDTTGR